MKGLVGIWQRASKCRGLVGIWQRVSKCRGLVGSRRSASKIMSGTCGLEAENL